MKMKRSIRPLLFVLTLLVVPTLHADNLYDERSFRPLVADIRANTSEDAKFSLNAGIKDATGPASAGLDIESNSDGAARTARGGNLRAQVSARVEKKLENGNLFIRGKQTIRVNGEEQEIQLEGVVRPVDIAGANVVLSTRIMDAKIEYSGQEMEIGFNVNYLILIVLFL